MKAQNIRLRNNLLIRVLVPMAIVMLVSGVIGYYQAKNFVNASYDRSLLEEARGLAAQVQIVGSDVLLDMPEAADEILRADTTDHIYYQVRDLDAEVIAGDTVLPTPPSRPQRSMYYDAEIQGERVRVVVVPMLPATSGRSIVVQFAETRYKRKSLASEIVIAVIAPQLALMVLAWIAIQRGVMVGLSSIERLASTIEQRSLDDLAPLPVAGMPQEMLPLLAAFNAMLRRVDGAAAAQKRFVADAAHQLRTPLAALRIQLERALRETDPALRETLFQQLVVAVERAARLSTQLLLLARAEPGASVARVERLDLCQVAFDTGSAWINSALQKGVDLGLDTPAQPLYVQGEGVMLGELINNLIDNALHYGGPHITLRVASLPEGGVELSVEDDGQGVPAEEEARIFERFYRAPGSSGDGSGLGLAIVREIARGFGAEAGYRRGTEGGACFFVRFDPA